MEGNKYQLKHQPEWFGCEFSEAPFRGRSVNEALAFQKPPNYPPVARGGGVDEFVEAKGLSDGFGLDHFGGGRPPVPNEEAVVPPRLCKRRTKPVLGGKKRSVLTTVSAFNTREVPRASASQSAVAVNVLWSGGISGWLFAVIIDCFETSSTAGTRPLLTPS